MSKRKGELLQLIQDLDKQEATSGLSEEFRFSRNQAKDEFQELVIRQEIN